MWAFAQQQKQQMAPDNIWPWWNNWQEEPTDTSIWIILAGFSPTDVSQIKTNRLAKVGKILTAFFPEDYEMKQLIINATFFECPLNLIHDCFMFIQSVYMINSC